MRKSSLLPAVIWLLTVACLGMGTPLFAQQPDPIERAETWRRDGAGAPPTLASPIVYEGQVTRIDYPDGTHEIIGYDAGEQLDWRYSQDGRYTELVRDALHRVTQVVYPATSGYGAITVTTQFDEFGRVEQTSDGNGTSTFSFDDLNRLTSATPAVGQAASYTYGKDLTNRRWITNVTLSGGIGTWQFGEDRVISDNQKWRPYCLTKESYRPTAIASREMLPMDSFLMTCWGSDVVSESAAD